MTAASLEAGLCMVDADVDDAGAAIRLLAERAVAEGVAHPSYVDAVLAREEEYPTGLPLPVPAAIPHVGAEHVVRPALGALVPRAPITFGEMGSRDRTIEARLVLMLFVTDPQAQVPLLGRVIGVLRAPDLDETLLTGLAGPDDLASRLNALLA
ncbi:PTS system IIA component, Gat family [Nocardioides exalbidus]|uniref:PTS system IIA component, Gat family n=1 Tax=Nocardioides exalbidus TaxID=402596 RepID=A0A1H4S9S2_9ACTN|nr:PTS sugar transporter subunit IIA [Nocardioides exalbidus]SEC40872.1 PTS system IIA component, Gat family [Nocardioides exalbidus]